MTSPDLSALLDRISAAAFMPEEQAVAACLQHCAAYEAAWPAIADTARGHITRLREGGLGVSVESFLQEYGLSSQEGVAVMCLAEALLRIPDRATADALIESSFAGANWQTHLGHSDSLMVNAASWGLLLTGKLLQADHADDEPDSLLSQLVKSASEPVIREALKRAMKLIASQFVLGETIEDSLARSSKWAAQHYRFSYDMLGEGARSMTQADHYFASYRHAIAAIGKTLAATKNLPPLYERPSISIKLTALHPRYEWRQREQVMQELLPRLKRLVHEAHAAGICVAIDAEESTRLDLELEIFAALFTDPDFTDYHGIGFVLQAYQKRAIHVVDYLVHLCSMTGKTMPVRLVKGAYWDSEIKAAQIGGLPDYPVYTRKSHSDVSYLACAQKLLQHSPQHFYPQFATHNAVTLSAIGHIAAGKPHEFQRLFGMGEALYAPIAAHTPCRIYAPIGEHRDLLAYLIRRLLENGANSSFVNQILNHNIPVETLLETPIAQAKQSGGKAAIAPPAELYGSARRNSSGIDWGNRVQLRELLDSLAPIRPTPAPADSDSSLLDAMIARANEAFATWRHISAEARATQLERAADLLESRRAEALSLLVSEGKKTLLDALSEWREAIDFCRYYAQQCRALFSAPIRLDGPTGEHNRLSLHGRGVFICISPWNFPLAIFMGQITAALAAGNCVIAKPAEQTPAIAAFAASLLHQAGVPKTVLQCAYGDGVAIGAALVAHPAIAGVAFTGSTAVAKQIERMLAAKDGPIIPLIAETGGQNAMIVDASALPEQAVDDILQSAFGSAGQRCSALRVLFLQHDIAEHLIALLKDAMQSLRIGNPSDITTDIGPLIDAAAAAAIRTHCERMTRDATRLAIAPFIDGLAGDFVVPHLFEIHDIAQLETEHFGPVLHVIRYDAEALASTIQAIESTGYGLTFGLHSRIRQRCDALADTVSAGNIYINRSMTGAVVGVQPFGGGGLSGTGPKAGGPYTLLRYASEKTISINSAAIGGNVELLMG